MKTYAILTDVTRCIGCEKCVDACKQANATGEDDAPWRWQDGPQALSTTRWTTIHRTQEGRFVRDQCRHCLEPACVDACPVQALYRTAEGTVAYDPDICLGCRYCILACPFRAARFEYGSPNPEVRKCTLCHERIASGEIAQPACTAACPEEATIFGERDALIAEARRRIHAHPDRYLDHIWGEHEIGGTGVLYISDVKLDHYGWPGYMTRQPVTATTERVMHTVPVTFAGVSLGLGGLSWVIGRRQKRARERAEQVVSPTNNTDTDNGEEIT